MACRQKLTSSSAGRSTADCCLRTEPKMATPPSNRYTFRGVLLVTITHSLRTHTHTYIPHFNTAFATLSFLLVALCVCTCSESTFPEMQDMPSRCHRELTKEEGVEEEKDHSQPARLFGAQCHIFMTAALLLMLLLLLFLIALPLLRLPLPLLLILPIMIRRFC